MATSTIKGKKGYVNTSFSAMGTGYQFTALNNIDSAIGSYTSGVGTIVTGGPVYGYILVKYSNIYYSGFLIGYGQRNPLYFRRENQTYYVNEIL